MLELVKSLQVSDELVLTMKAISELAAGAKRHMAVMGWKFGVGLSVTGQVASALEGLPTASVSAHMQRLERGYGLKRGLRKHGRMLDSKTCLNTRAETVDRILARKSFGREVPLTVRCFCRCRQPLLIVGCRPGAWRTKLAYLYRYGIASV